MPKLWSLLDSSMCGFSVSFSHNVPTFVLGNQWGCIFPKMPTVLAFADHGEFIVSGLGEVFTDQHVCPLKSKLWSLEMSLARDMQDLWS